MDIDFDHIGCSLVHLKISAGGLGIFRERDQRSIGGGGGGGGVEF